MIKDPLFRSEDFRSAEIQRRLYPEYPKISFGKYGIVSIEWYPDYTEFINMESIIAPDNMAQFIEGARNDYKEYFGCERAQENLEDLDFCTSCKPILNQLPEAHDLYYHYYQTGMGCMDETVLALCPKDRMIWHSWLFEQVLNQPKESHIPIELVFLQLEEIQLTRMIDHLEKERIHYKKHLFLDQSLIYLEEDIETLRGQAHAVEAEVKNWIEKNSEASWAWWFEYEE